ncbi:transposon protein, CACTA, En/Spm sub-class [Tanacetum coccineum]
MQNGISAGYDEWTHHGESCDVSDDSDDDDVSFNDEEAGSDNMNGGNDDDDADDDLDEILQRLFINLQVSNDMRWHKDVRVNDDNVATHPADSEAWKHFDREFPLFANDPRNVRLGLATDGFNPFGNLSSSYSIWPVFVVPYNLPPWKCMKDPYMFMSMLILGPKTPTNIDVYLQPLIDELNDLWGGWSVKGYNACPICMNETSSSYLSHSRKVCYMGHRRFLPSSHQWQNDKMNFDGTRQTRKPIVPMSGLEVLHDIDCTISEPCCSVKKRKRKNLEGKKGWKKEHILPA